MSYSYLRDLSFALLAEREQVAVDEVGMRGGQAVRTLIHASCLQAAPCHGALGVGETTAGCDK